MLLTCLGGCSNPAPAISSAVSDAVETVQITALPAINSASITVSELLPPQPVISAPLADPAAVALVVRWEVGSPAQYARQYQGVICPGGASGPTIGIGYDLGTQSPAQIRASWGWHRDIDALVTASGQVGPDRCKAWATRHKAIRVAYSDAIRVFEQQDWPTYVMASSRAYRNGWDALTLTHQGGLTSNGYNRGFSFAGDRRKEMRAIRDDCVPGNSAPCTAGQLRASCRIWEGTDVYKGLCARRNSEADFTLRIQ